MSEPEAGIPADIQVYASEHVHQWAPGPARVTEYFHENTGAFDGRSDRTVVTSVFIVCPCGKVDWQDVEP